MAIYILACVVALWLLRGVDRTAVCARFAGTDVSWFVSFVWLFSYVLFAVGAVGLAGIAWRELFGS